MANQCGSSSQVCQNGGTCTEGWNRPLCDCSSTLYTGPTCGRGKSILYLFIAKFLINQLNYQNGNQKCVCLQNQKH